MKKMIVFLLAAVMLLSLAACSGEQKPDADDTTTEPSVEDQQTTTEGAPAEDEGVYSFTAEGVELVPGAPFDPAVLPEADSIYQVPSCAIEGTDNVYSYGAYEVTAYDDGTGEVIYSVYLIDANTSTPEGLYLGDDLARVTELYGSDYTQNDTELVYTKGTTTLRLILDSDCVISIEYRMAD